MLPPRVLRFLPYVIVTFDAVRFKRRIQSQIAERQFHREGRSLVTAGTGGVDGSRMQVDEHARDYQAEAKASEFSTAFGRVITLRKSREDPREFLWREAKPAVGDLHLHAIRDGIHLGRNRELAAARGELDGVLDDVPEDLLQPHVIAQHNVLLSS